MSVSLSNEHTLPKETDMRASLTERLAEETAALQTQGLYKAERVIDSPQQARITLADGSEVLNFCANNYLGLANHPRLINAAKHALDHYGYGMASVRFICGTQSVHKRLEERLTSFLGTEDTILYGSCFDANGGLFETLLGPEDAIISDELNHASIIDGVRLCKARRLRYKNNDMADLEAKLREAADCRHVLVVTDGVFSMDGIVADLGTLCDLAEQYGALTMVDDSHATGFMGDHGRGSHEHRGVMGRIDILTGTLGKALGGASGGYTSGRKEIIEWLRQRSRPYLFSNTLCPSIAAASLEALDMIEGLDELRDNLRKNSRIFRQGMTEAGFDLVPGEHPIIPVMLGDARVARDMAASLLKKGVYVIGFSYPVVPQGKARIRTQMSAAHTPEQVRQAVDAFIATGREMNLIA